MKVLKVCISTWQNENRDKRELSVIQELGHEVEVIAKGDVSGLVEDVDGFRVTRLSSRPLGNKIPASINRVLSLFTWARYIRKRKDIDAISGHDYLALTIGYLSNIFKRKKAKLVYDSHEFELGRNQKRSKPVHWFVCHWERFLMKRCAFSIMVNDAIADEVQRIHKLKNRPVVARNIPAYWELDQEKITQTRKAILSQLDAPEDAFIMMYHGGILQNRGIEQMLTAVSQLENIYAVVLGNAQTEAYMASLHALVDKLGISKRVLFHPAVSINVLGNYIGATNAGMSLLQPTVQNHILALPNKFFENIQCLTPVIVSDFPAIGSIVDQYEIGLKVNPASPEEIATAIDRLRHDKTLYASFKENLKQAKEDLCWEKEKLVLQDAYRRILT
ncbi:MAG: glycosyltransferase [Oscillospiraceae bacterium]|nr:glycosyltransferase [Oscillospiraceae bacterium]